MLRIAITGGIGSGKTSVTEYLSSRGFDVIDADLIAHEMTGPGGSAIPYIIETFGSEYICPDGSMDRKKMSTRVYGDEKSLHLLEAGTTDRIADMIVSEMDEREKHGDAVAFADIPLLFEKNEQKRFDAVWLVTADREIRIKRLVARDGRKRDEILGIMVNQLEDVEKIELADDVIDNSGTIYELRSKLESLLKKYNL